MATTKIDIGKLSNKQLIDELTSRLEKDQLTLDDIQQLNTIVEIGLQKQEPLPTPKTPEMSNLTPMAFTIPFFVKQLTKDIYKKPSPELRRLLLRHLKLNFRDEWIAQAGKVMGQ